MDQIVVSSYDSPCGALKLGSFAGRLCMCDWDIRGSRGHVADRLRRILRAGFVDGSSSVITLAANQLDEYFVGIRQRFDIPLLFAGTEFQKSVWHALLDIPFGHTITYRELAARIGAPKAVRAVASANKANALSILAPCHRVIGSDGSLTGYAGGLEAKSFLLHLEGNH